MMHFSTMTPDEFISLNRDSIPEGMIAYFDALQSRLAILELEVKTLRKDNELTYEQQCFGVDLVNEIKTHVEGSNSKIAKSIRLSIENSYFET